jgi:aspartate/methionine/tyrosine aminotransferase
LLIINHPHNPTVELGSRDLFADIVALRDCYDDVRQQAGVYQNRRDTLCQGLKSMRRAL